MPETRRTGSRSGLSMLPDRRKQGRQGTSGMASPAKLVGLRAAGGQWSKVGMMGKGNRLNQSSRGQENCFKYAHLWVRQNSQRRFKCKITNAAQI